MARMDTVDVAQQALDAVQDAREAGMIARRRAQELTRRQAVRDDDSNYALLHQALGMIESADMALGQARARLEGVLERARPPKHTIRALVVLALVLAPLAACQSPTGSQRPRDAQGTPPKDTTPWIAPSSPRLMSGGVTTSGG